MGSTWKGSSSVTASSRRTRTSTRKWTRKAITSQEGMTEPPASATQDRPASSRSFFAPRQGPARVDPAHPTLGRAGAVAGGGAAAAEGPGATDGDGARGREATMHEPELAALVRARLTCPGDPDPEPAADADLHDRAMRRRGPLATRACDGSPG